ncbi:hypothetical protein Tco_1310444 [Tanacetum coccineum]
MSEAELSSHTSLSHCTKNPNESRKHQKLHLPATQERRNNEKALNILLSAIHDRHLLSFHDATYAKTLWSAIKARFGGNEASKKMQKNLLNKQFGRLLSDLGRARFKHMNGFRKILLLQVGLGQPGLDELEFDDLYNNLKVYEHELKGVSNSKLHQNHCFSVRLKSKAYFVKTNEIICSCSLPSTEHAMPTTHDDGPEDPLISSQRMGLPLISQRLNALIVKSWVILLGSADLAKVSGRTVLNGGNERRFVMDLVFLNGATKLMIHPRVFSLDGLRS